jgi:hypothetical protein
LDDEYMGGYMATENNVPKDDYTDDLPTDLNDMNKAEPDTGTPLPVQKSKPMPVQNINQIPVPNLSVHNTEEIEEYKTEVTRLKALIEVQANQISEQQTKLDSYDQKIA